MRTVLFALEARPALRGLTGSILIVGAGAAAVLASVWARNAFNLCGLEPRTALGTLVLWLVVPGYIGVCAGIGYRVTSHVNLLSIWVGFVSGLAVLLLAAAVISWLSPLWHPEMDIVTLVMLGGGLRGFGGGNLVKARLAASGLPVLVCSAVVVFPVVWAILFLE